MPYNILKEMTDPKSDRQSYVLLTDGLSQIWEIKSDKEANRIVKMMNENSDSGWTYSVRKNCKN